MLIELNRNPSSLSGKFKSVIHMIVCVITQKNASDCGYDPTVVLPNGRSL